MASLAHQIETGAPDAVKALSSQHVGEMRAFLDRVRPKSAAEALRLLRGAYPTAPLSARVAACGLAG